MSKESLESSLSSMFANFADSLNRQNIQAYELVKEESDFVNAMAALEHFKGGHANTALYKVRNDQVCGMIQSTEAVHKSKLEILIVNYELFESHFRTVFERFEGMACCSDKTRTCLAYIIKYLMIGESIKFNYEGEYTYHLPEFVLTNHDEVIFYFNALCDLVYGKFDAYLTALQRLSEQQYLNSKAQTGEAEE